MASMSWGIGFYGMSVLLVEIHATRGWPIPLVSAAITTHYLVGAALISRLDDAHGRFGVARVTAAGLCLTAAGLLCWAHALHPWQLFGAALVSGAGWSATSSAAVNAMLAPWFARRRPVALSMALNGASLGGIVVAPAAVLLNNSVGFEATAIGAAVLLIGVLAPLARWQLALTPAMMGQTIDNDPPTVGAPAPAPPGAPLPRREIWRDPLFRRVMMSFGIAMFAQVGLLSHLLAYLADHMAEAQAAVLLGLTSLSAVIGRSVLGALAQRIERRTAAASSISVQLVGLLVLQTLDGPVALGIGCLLFGFGVGTMITMPTIILQTRFGSGASLGRAVGLVVAVHQGLFSFAPATFGLLRGWLGDYRLVLILATALMAFAAWLLLPGRADRVRH
ncbi:MAG: MFS transporter [Burkholderiaceae bacterium]